MADKIQLANFGSPIVNEPEYFTINDQVIMVKKTIPYEEVLDMIQWMVNVILDDRTFVSGPLYQIGFDFGILKYFTNIAINDFSDPTYDIKTIYEDYDIIKGNRIIDEVINKIDVDQLSFVKTTLVRTIKSLIDYRNSAQGIIDALGVQASQQTTAIDSALKEFQDPDKMQQVKKIMQLAEDLNLNK